MTLDNKDQASIKKIIQGAILEFWDKVLEPVLGEMHEDIKQLKKDTSELKRDTAQLTSGQSDLSRQLNDLKMDTPTQKEFTNLKKRVDHLEQFSLPN